MQIDEVMIGGRVRSLGPLEGRLLDQLLSPVGQVCSPEVLSLAVWGQRRELNTLHQLIHKLKLKVPGVIDNVHGRGWVLRRPVGMNIRRSNRGGLERVELRVPRVSWPNGTKRA